MKIGGWAVDPLPLAPLALVAGLYLRRAYTLAARGRPVSWLKQASFLLGLGLLAVALVSPIDPIGEQRVFYVHMIQHLLLGDLAPLLVVLGLNGALLRPLLAAPLVGRLRLLGHPLVALPLWALNLVLWHLPAAYESALAHPAVHGLEHGMFFTTGALMWAAVFEPIPGPAWFGNGPKAVYVLVVRALGAALANVFIWSGTGFYPAYAEGERLWGISPAADQAAGGAIMLVEGALVTVVAFGWLFLRWIREDELRQRLEDQGHDPATAARTARYGRSALARRWAP